ncbi:low density lipoprotein receptor adapter protein 1b isoform X1 [Leucoraja erinacea]|uniref:low density lipoprotein receptor adapter protein 1b isoform X1 n=1 Tax=Leucoraja erinaceus TaxID=7782 RepID=UPI0024573B66|nr:low density lipoprotein receptor adapter protein 1b isoform X1 [Leucoraja erinacea]
MRGGQREDKARPARSALCTNLLLGFIVFQEEEEAVSNNMDALKSAGRAIIRSPSIAKQSWGSGKHKKLPENWTDTRETLQEGMIFNLKYLGMTLVEEPKGEDMSSAAVRRIVIMAKASGKKFPKVVLTVSPRGIILHDSTSNELIENISIYRISYCTADKVHDKVFAYIAQSQLNETLECHAFLCTKKKLAQAVTLTVAQAFKIAFEFWQAAKEEKGKRAAVVTADSGATGKPCSEKSTNNHFKTGGNFQKPIKLQTCTSLRCGRKLEESHVIAEVATGDLLDLTEGAKPANHRRELSDADKKYSANDNLVWEINDDLDEAFARLAQSRTNPQFLDIGVSPQDMQTEECLTPTDWEKSDVGVTEKDDLFGL